MRTITVEVSRMTVESIQIEMPVEDDADLADISLERQAEARQIATSKRRRRLELAGYETSH
jgi:hypothetical protein